MRPRIPRLPFRAGTPMKQIRLPPAKGLDDTLSLLDDLCDIDTGKGCEEPVTRSVSVDVVIGEGIKPLPTMFELSDPDNEIKQIVTGLPSGIAFEQTEKGKIVVAELDEEGKGYKDGVRVGDILR